MKLIRIHHKGINGGMLINENISFIFQYINALIYNISNLHDHRHQEIPFINGIYTLAPIARKYMFSDQFFHHVYRLFYQL